MSEKRACENMSSGAGSEDDIDRRGFLECMAWAGTGVLWTLSGGVLSSQSLAQGNTHSRVQKGELYFVQISDSHIGFKGAANGDVNGTLRAAVNKINTLPVPPAFIVHTGDVTQDATDEQFDTCHSILQTLKTRDVLYVPGEHDVVDDEGAKYRQRLAPKSRGQGWYSFDMKGVHFIGLVNVMAIKSNGLGSLGAEQLEWLEKDVKRLKSSTPIVVMAHIPLWSVYPDWGWGTEDGAMALSYLKRFGAVTVLNGHIHQTLQKVEGNVVFHTACSTAFPKSKPGDPGGPGALKVESGRLNSLLGITQVTYMQGSQTLAITDSALMASDQP